jgi:hypothetical protein
MSQKPAVDAETYVKKIKERASPHGEFLEKMTASKKQQIEETMMDIDLLKAKKALREAGAGSTPVGSIVANIFVDKTPEQIKEILKDMTPEMIQNLQLIAASIDNNSLNTMALLRQQKGGDINETLLRLVLEQQRQHVPQNQGITLEGIAALVKALKDERPAPVIQSGSSSLDALKLLMEVNRPLYESLRAKDKEVMDAKLKEIEARMPGTLDEQIKYVKEMAPLLGLTGGETNELDLKLEEMKEQREIDLKRLDWEERKYELENESDNRKWEQIGKILQGPVGEVIKNMGSAGADRVRGAPSKLPTPVKTQCPNCNQPIFVDADSAAAVCGSCGAVLQRQGVPPVVPAPSPVPQETPSARVEGTPAPHVEPEQEEEEIEAGPQETQEQSAEQSEK